jgi:hypothetical protein
VTQSRYHTISALAESPLTAGKLYAGTSDGNVWSSVDGGESWTDVTPGLPDRYVTSIHASRNIEGTVWVTHSGYRGNDFFPHIHQSTDHGLSWQTINGNLPPLAINKVLVHPEDEQMLFVATDAGVYATLDGGFYWERLGDGMPFLPVFDLAYDPVDRRLIAGTHGRSMMSFPVDSILLSSSLEVPVTHKQDALLTIAPNPANASTSVLFSVDEMSFANLVLRDVQSRIVGQWHVFADQPLEIETHGLNSGLYFMELTSKRQRISKILLISH